MEVVITDNASNIVKAFKRTLEGASDEVEEEQEVAEADDIDFEEREIDHDVTFKCYCKRLGCLLTPFS